MIVSSKEHISGAARSGRGRRRPDRRTERDRARTLAGLTKRSTPTLGRPGYVTHILCFDRASGELRGGGPPGRSSRPRSRHAPSSGSKPGRPPAPPPAPPRARARPSFPFLETKCRPYLGAPPLSLIVIIIIIMSIIILGPSLSRVSPCRVCGLRQLCIQTMMFLTLLFVLGKTPHDETPHWGDPKGRNRVVTRSV
jgi:hypothetical protein